METEIAESASPSPSTSCNKSDDRERSRADEKRRTITVTLEDAAECRRRELSEGWRPFDWRSAGGAGDASELERLNKTIGLPERYRFANLLTMTHPTGSPRYAAAVDDLASLMPWFRFSARDASPGAIVGMIGNRGTGKTHLAGGLVNVFTLCHYDAPASRRGEGWPMYRRAFDLFASIKSTFGRKADETQAAMVDEWATASLLVIDEVQVRSDSAWEDSILTNLIDRRYAELRPTVLISNLQERDFIDSVGDSVASRMVEVGSLIVADWPSFRGRS